MATKWRKASKSHLGGIDQGNCVELARLNPAKVGARDSKQGNGPVLVVSVSDWRSFAHKVKAGRYDLHAV